MAYPTIQRTWQYQVNVVVAAGGTQLITAQTIWRTLKDILKGSGTWTNRNGETVASLANWTVSGSSNAGTAGMDGVDRWTNNAALVWADSGEARSWIVLRQPGIHAQSEILFALEGFVSAVPEAATTAASPSVGYTGGSTTSRPTATDAIGMTSGLNSASPGLVPNTNVGVVLHVMKSSDGAATRVITCRSGFSTTFWGWERPIHSVDGWTVPYVGWTLGNSGSPSSSLLTYVEMAKQTSGTGGSCSRINGLAPDSALGAGSRAALPFSTECIGSATSTSIDPIGDRMGLNDLSSKYPITPVGLDRSNTSYASVRGRHAWMSDLWFGSDAVVDGSTYPLDSSKQFAQFGVVIVPWNGTVPVMTA